MAVSAASPLSAPPHGGSLLIDDLSVSYGGVSALRGVSLRADPGEAIAVIGANGAGKSTLLRTISGLEKTAAGRVTFDGADITDVAPDRVAARGLRLVPEARQVFANLTVNENLTLGGYTLFRSRDRRRAEELRAQMYDQFPSLRVRSRTRAGNLSGGEQQMLAMARALMGRPTLLMLDEPSTGLAPKIVDEVFTILNSLRPTGLTVLLVEQIATKALQWADRAYVLELGQVTVEGTSAELRSNPRIEAAYLGRAQEAS
jgi:branched-chain amino acid transport system ATP-binding protein